MIPGTNIPDRGVWEGEVPYKNRFVFTPDDNAVPIPKVPPPNPSIDPTMEIPYDISNEKFRRKYWDL